MALDPVILSRIQFFWVIGWHILLPAFTIGLASYIMLMEGLHMITGREIYFRISAFWIKIFSVAFGMRVGYWPHSRSRSRSLSQRSISRSW